MVFRREAPRLGGEQEFLLGAYKRADVELLLWHDTRPDRIAHLGLPDIIYNTKKDKKDGAKKPRAGEVNDAMRRWKNKYGKKGNKVNLDLNEYK